MQPILWAGAGMGKVLETRAYANHVVIERHTEPGLVTPDPALHWLVRTFAGRWQVGFTLANPVRLVQPCLPGPVAFLADVVKHLETVYEGERVMRYMNPTHPANAAQLTAGSKPASLTDLADRREGRARGGRSRSEAKIMAARENLAGVNNARAEAGTERAERYQHLRAGGLTVAEIAAREGTTVNAVKCALKRARRADAAEVARLKRQRAEWEALRARHAQQPTAAAVVDEEEILGPDGWPLSWWEEEQLRSQEA